MKQYSKNGFTLVELLSGIAIIAILAGILIPTVGNMRQKALEASSQSNIRQVGMAYLMVAHDNGGILPSVYGKDGDSSSEKDNWDRLVNELLTDGESIDNPGYWSEAFHDPAAVAQEVISPDVKYHFAPLGAITRGDGSKTGSGAAPKALRTYNRLIRHQYPERQILLMDAGVNSPTSTPWGDLLHGESFGWSGNWNGRFDVSKADEPIDPGTGMGGDIRWDENGDAKFFFLDGHVEKRNQADVLEKNLNPLF